MVTHTNNKSSSIFSKSCKKFQKPKALAFYILIPDPDSIELRHREMLRIVNPKVDEFYVIPRPLDKSDFHISYHRSGRFHWNLNKKYHFPKERKEDFCVAFSDYLRLQASFGWIVGFCFACGPKVSKGTLGKMLQILAEYIPVDVSLKLALDDIYQRKHVTQWNPHIKAIANIKRIPMSAGIMLAELKDAPGTLHTINCILTSDRGLYYYRRVLNSQKNAFEIKEIVQEDIERTHFVLM